MHPSDTFQMGSAYKVAGEAVCSFAETFADAVGLPGFIALLDLNLNRKHVLTAYFSLITFQVRKLKKRGRPSL